MTDNTIAAAVRRTYYGSGTPVSPVYFDDIYDNLPSTDVLDPVLLYDNQYQITGYVWDANLGKQVLNNNSPVYETPAYGNEGGTGDRRSIITVSTNGAFFDVPATMPPLLVDGVLDSYLYTENNVPVVGKYIKFTFQHKVIITQAKWYMGIGGSVGTVKWQISEEDDGTLIDVGNSFALRNATVDPYAVLTELSSNITPAKAYYIKGVSGNTDWNQVFSEIQFKIANPI